MLLANWSAAVSNCKLDIWSAAKPIGSANLVATSVAAITVGFWVASSAAVSVPSGWRAISAAAITVGFSTLWAGIWQFMIWLLIADNRSRGITMALMRSCVSRIGGICLVSLWVSSTCFLSSWGIGLYGLCLLKDFTSFLFIVTSINTVSLCLAASSCGLALPAFQGKYDFTILSFIFEMNDEDKDDQL